MEGLAFGGNKRAFIFPWEKFNFGNCCHPAISVTLVLQQPKPTKKIFEYLEISQIILKYSPPWYLSFRPTSNKDERAASGNNLPGSNIYRQMWCIAMHCNTKQNVKSWYFQLPSRIWQEMGPTGATRNKSQTKQMLWCTGHINNQLKLCLHCLDINFRHNWEIKLKRTFWQTSSCGNRWLQFST